ncbi:Receptor-like protein 12 [Morella rubra]|uniref:Receptor-like protein 12 n=1 Tax=Morella rubra TaxID=262757 RepID=A0A6A1WYC9_9ROSI|nr:Receptor-like protein 12 [Morella rubra]
MKVSIFLWLFFSIPICSIFPGLRIFLVPGQCLGNQQSILLQLKNSLMFDSAQSTKLVHWNQNADCCSWEGVNCSEGHVVGLDLSSESIYGGLDNSSSIFSLQYLQNLSLAYNYFYYSEIPSEFDKLKNLSYLNLSNAGFAGQIPIAISRLTRLLILDLSALQFLGTPLLKLENPDLEMLVQNLPELIELYLDGVNISARGNEWCLPISSSLPKLRVLSLSNCYLSGPMDSSLMNLQALSIIRLDNNNLSTPVPEFFANFRNLKTLGLSSCGLDGIFPEKIFQVPTLQILDLSNNPLLRGSFPDFHRNGYLRSLVLSETNFSGTLPDSIGNLTMLSRLDLFWCNFSGSIPNSMAKLSHLIYLDMSFNNLTGPIPSLSRAKNLTEFKLAHNHLTGQITRSSWHELLNLVNLDLRYNSLNGSIPLYLFSLPSLRKLQLSNNHFSGQLNELSNISSYLLDTLDLSSNELEGPIPLSFFKLRGLLILSLSSNYFSGPLQLNVIHQMRNLSNLDLSYNNLSIEYSGVNSLLPSFSQISTLKLASGNLKTFPDFLRNQSRLTVLDLSDNQIRGEIPSWIGKLPYLQNLNLSFNFLLTLQDSLFHLSSLIFLDLRSNQLQGQLPVLPPFATYLDLSKNNFSYVIPASIGNSLSYTYFLSLSSNKFYGSIPRSICNAPYLQVLDLSNNFFSGTIPQCLIEMSGTLGVLNLRRNNLRGTIPDAFPHSCALQTLDLSGNQLEGKLPKSLANCTKLEVFNVGNNHLKDLFPCHLKNISMLRVLVLRSNKFKGPINGCPGPDFTWTRLQIFDVASNNFTGKFPFKNLSAWKAMMDGEDEARSELTHLQFNFLGFDELHYQDSVSVTVKGLDIELVKILTIFTSIDLSCNSLDGRIPEEVGVLKSLYVLNLSHNGFTGQIPISLANLTHLESLDLSSNKLTGNIPVQLAESLNFLSVLNLSFNQLVGKIPNAKQFSTFSDTSFEGNKGLCGFPLKDKCTPVEAAPPSPLTGEIHSNSKVRIDWNFISAELGFIFGFGVFIWPLMFWKRWRICDLINVGGGGAQWISSEAARRLLNSREWSGKLC